MSNSKTEYVLEEQIGYILRLVSQRHTGIFQEKSVQSTTPMQFAAMIKISDLGECSQNRLGRLTGMDVATIKGVVDRLGQKGLVTSKSDPKDKRRLLLSLSDKGEELVKKMKEAGQEITNETLAPLTPQEQENLLKTLRKLT